MADDPKKENKDGAEDGEGKSKGKSKLIKLGGGVVGLLVVAFIAATLAIPSKEVKHRFGTPFTIPMLPDKDAKIPVNLDENNKTRFLQMKFNFLVRAFKDDYVKDRQVDPNYAPFMRSRLIAVATSKKIDEVIGGRAVQEAFLEEIREELEPILFPVHVGNSGDPLERHEDSGLMPGSMMNRSSFRGKYYDHLLTVNGPGKSLRIDDGPEIFFTGQEVNLPVSTGSGEVLYLDVTDYEPEYVGDIPIGVHGRIMQVLSEDLIAQ